MMKNQRVVLVGAQGQGKTTFFNRITNQTQITKYAGPSCTRKIVQAYTQYFQGFCVVDTPGFPIFEDKLLHIAGILAALTYGTINRIIIVVKYDRDNQITQNITILYNLVKKYKELVTIVITHMDICQNDQSEKQRIGELIQKKFQIDSILFTSQKDDPEIICGQIEVILTSLKKEEQIKLLESEIFKHFDFLEVDDENETQLTKHKQKVFYEFKKVAVAYRKFIASLNSSDSNYLIILHEIIQSVIKQADYQVEKFQKENGQEIQNMVDISGNNLQYLHYICLKKEIKNELEDVIKKTQQRMSESNLHFFNFLKKCPHCSCIWLKVNGCDGLTKCGSRVNENFDGLLFIQPKKKIEILFDQKQNSLSYQVNETNTGNDQHEQLFAFIQKLENVKSKKLTNQQLEQIFKQYIGNNYQEILVQKLLYGNNQLEEEILSYIEIDRISRNPEQLDILPQKLQSQTQFKIEQKDSLTKTPSQYIDQQKKQGLGCGMSFDWKELQPLSPEEINELFETELLNYFADSERIEQEEINWLDKTCKEIVIQAIKDKQQEIIQLDQSMQW